MNSFDCSLCMKELKGPFTLKACLKFNGMNPLFLQLSFKTTPLKEKLPSSISPFIIEREICFHLNFKLKQKITFIPTKNLVILVGNHSNSNFKFKFKSLLNSNSLISHKDSPPFADSKQHSQLSQLSIANEHLQPNLHSHSNSSILHGEKTMIQFLKKPT